jgi:hypothetical protein
VFDVDAAQERLLEPVDVGGCGAGGRGPQPDRSAAVSVVTKKPAFPCDNRLTSPGTAASEKNTLTVHFNIHVSRLCIFNTSWSL